MDGENPATAARTESGIPSNALSRAGKRPVPPRELRRSVMAPDRPIAVTDATFDYEVENSPIPVLLDFWAPWCAPCRFMDPSIQQVARERAGSLKIAKVNVDENPELIRRFRVRTVPMMVYLVGEQAVEQFPGSLSKTEIDRRLNRHFACN